MYVMLGSGKPIGLGKYVAAWKACLALPPERHIGGGISGWGESAGEALRELRHGLHARINRHLPYYGKGRKWSYEWQGEAMRAAHQLNHPRLIIRQLPEWLKGRFAHRIEA